MVDVHPLLPQSHDLPWPTPCPSKYRDDHQRRCEQCWRHSFHHWMWCFLYLTGCLGVLGGYMIPVVGECSKIKLQRKTTNGFISSTGLEEPVQCCTGLQTNLEEQCLPRPFWRLCQPDQGMDLAPFWAKGLGVETCIATERPSNCIKWLNWSYSSLDSCGQDNGCHRIIAD